MYIHKPVTSGKGLAPRVGYRGPRSCVRAEPRLPDSPGRVLDSQERPASPGIRRRENMVGVNMVLAEYPQNTLYHRIL